jgi:glutamyl-tRNA synthetase
MLAGQLDPANATALTELLDAFNGVDWTRDAIGAAIRANAARHGLKPSQLMMPLRALVAGTLGTPAIDAVLELVGRDATRARMTAGMTAL